MNDQDRSLAQDEKARREGAIDEAFRRFPDVAEPIPDHPKGRIAVDRGNLRYAFVEGALFAFSRTPAATEDVGDAATLRGFIKEHGATPSMVAADRDHWKRRAEQAEAQVERASRLIPTANLLFQNSVACAVQHHGLDIELNGLPGWLADCKKVLDEANEIPPPGMSHSSTVRTPEAKP